MTREIIERLLDYTPEQDVDLAQLMVDAANEIQRLDRLANRWQQAAERFAESDAKFDAFVFYFRALRETK